MPVKKTLAQLSIFTQCIIKTFRKANDSVMLKFKFFMCETDFSISRPATQKFDELTMDFGEMRECKTSVICLYIFVDLVDEEAE